MAATAATHQVWRAARWDHEKAPTSPALRACATTKQVQVKHTQIFITDILPCMRNVVPLISQSALTYPLKGITQTSTTVSKTKRRTGQTAVWTAGRTLRKTVSARVKRRRKRARAAMIRWGDKLRTCHFVECRVFSHMFKVKLWCSLRSQKPKVVRRTGTPQATIWHQQTFVEPKTFFPPYVVTSSLTFLYGRHGQSIKATSAFTWGLQRQI